MDMERKRDLKARLMQHTFAGKSLKFLRIPIISKRGLINEMHSEQGPKKLSQPFLKTAFKLLSNYVKEAQKQKWNSAIFAASNSLEEVWAPHSLAEV